MSEINIHYNIVYVPTFVYSVASFSADGAPEYLPCGTIPIPSYLVKEEMFYLNGGKTHIEYHTVPIWTPDHPEIVELAFDKENRCVSDAEMFDIVYKSFEDCHRYCFNVLNPEIIDLRFKSMFGADLNKVPPNTLQHIYNDIEKVMNEAMALAKSKDNEVKQMIHNQRQR